MTPTEKAPTKIGRPPKKQVTMPQTGPGSALTKAIAAKATALIMKACKQKPLQPSYSTLPHLPSGSTIVNLLIGGGPAVDGNGCVCPGYPRRRITEIYGHESSGKTTLALAAIVDCQQRDGIAMFLDFEHSLHHGYAKTIGVDFSPEKLLYYQPDTFEEGIRMLYLGIRAGVDLIVVDSVAAMVPAAELTKDIGDNARIGALAKAMSELLPKMVIWLSNFNSATEAKEKGTPQLPGTAVILINQTRAIISSGGWGGGGEKENTSGGKALKFYMYVRLSIQRIKSEFVKKKDPYTGKDVSIPIGNLVQVKVVKDKCDGKQGHKAEIFIRYGYGLDDILSLIEAGITRKIIDKNGATLSFEGENYRGRESLRQMLLVNPNKAETIKAKVYESILSCAPQAVTLTDEDDVMSDMRANMGDDEMTEGVNEDSSEEEVVPDAGEARASSLQGEQE